ncbi:alpha/beta hydrolase [Streptomyces sp. NPDC050625]|uniref:alpha/beta fold hydrolase n=1 Tax=Streptomyces sp. NPDC050625 TaxID=3154629 RepID=UPI003436F950
MRSTGLPARSTDLSEWLTGAYASLPRRTTVEVDGRLSSVRSWGDPEAPTVLLVHGNQAHAGWWDHLGPRLVTGRHVVAFDLFGHGDSAWLPSYSWDAWAEQVKSIAASYGAKRVVGHSLGGSLALTAAARFGAPFERLVLLDTPLRGTRRTARAPASLAPPRPGPYPLLERARERFRLVPPSPRDPHPLILEHLFRESVHRVEGGWGWKRDPVVLARQGEAPGLRELVDAPGEVVLVRSGLGLVRDDVMELVRDAGGELFAEVVVEDAGHHVILDSPRRVLSVLLDVL